MIETIGVLGMGLMWVFLIWSFLVMAGVGNPFYDIEKEKYWPKWVEETQEQNPDMWPNDVCDYLHFSRPERRSREERVARDRETEKDPVVQMILSRNELVTARMARKIIKRHRKNGPWPN